MATQTILFAAASGLSITAARLFSGASDTIAATAAATEQTNAKGWYSAAYTDLAAGLYRVVALDANSTTLAIWWVRCAGGNSTAFATETPDATEWTLARAGYMDAMLQADNGNQRTVQVNGNRHIAAAVHTCEDNSITAAAIAADAVNEIQAGLALEATSQTINSNVLSRLAAASYVAPDNASITAVKAVTDKLNTGLAVDGQVWQFTANMLELAPAGGGGGGGSGDATSANQVLILDQLDLIQAKTDLLGTPQALVAGAVLEPGTITSFPETLTIGDSYTQANGRAIMIPIIDTNGNPISSAGTLLFADAEVTFTIKRSHDTEPSRILNCIATFVDPPGTGTGEAPYALIQIPASETSKGLIKYQYSGVLKFTWTGTASEVVSYETGTIIFDN